MARGPGYRVVRGDGNGGLQADAHPQAEAIGPTSDDATPESRDAAAGQGSAQEASPVAGAKTEPGPSDPEAEDAGPRAIAAGADVGDALTPEPGEQERQEAAPTGGGCRASAGGTPDVAHVAILLGLVGAGLRRRWRGGAKGEG